MKYPIYKPYLKGNVKKYINDCIDSTWISSKGKYVSLFEEKVANYVEAKYASSVFNGTIALHLALLTLGIGKGDKVIVPDFTYIATANAVKYVGAEPILVDVSKDDWNITLSEIRRVFTNEVKAIIVVDIFGTQPRDLEQISNFAKKNNIYLIQDSAESLGSKYKWMQVGAFSDITTLSFFGNKTITTGEGGMLLTNNSDLYMKMEVLKNQGNSSTRRYYHDVLGYNFRMTNIQAAIGLSQIELIDEILEKKAKVIDLYKKYLSGIVEFQKVNEVCSSSNWLISIIPNEDKDILAKRLDEASIETRPFFQPVSSMPFYEEVNNPISYFLGEKGISLPSYPYLEEDDIKLICDIIKEKRGK